MFSETYLSERSREFVNAYQDEFNRRLTNNLQGRGILDDKSIEVKCVEGKKYGFKQIVPVSDLSLIFDREDQTIRKRIKEGVLNELVFFDHGYYLSPFAAAFLYAPQREHYRDDSHIYSREVLDELLLSPEKDPGLVELITKGYSLVYGKNFFHCYDILHQRWALEMEDDDKRAKLMNGHDKVNGKINGKINGKVVAKREKPSPEQAEIERLVKSHTNFVYSVIHKMGIHEADRKGRVDPNWDIAVSAGMYGLFEAARRYDSSRGNQFIPYAVKYIKGYILQDLLANHSIVKLGTSQAQRKLFYGIPKWLRGEIKELSPKASVEDAAEHFEVSVKSVKNVIERLANRDTSLDAQLFDDSKKTLADTIISDVPGPEEAITPSAPFAKELTESVVGVLDPRERYIIDHRDMADEEDKEILEDIGKYLGITKERTRQLEAKARDKLRKAVIRKYPDLYGGSSGLTNRERNETDVVLFLSSVNRSFIEEAMSILSDSEGRVVHDLYLNKASSSFVDKHKGISDLSLRIKLYNRIRQLHPELI